MGSLEKIYIYIYRERAEYKTGQDKRKKNVTCKIKTNKRNTQKERKSHSKSNNTPLEKNNNINNINSDNGNTERGNDMLIYNFVIINATLETNYGTL